MNQAVFDPRLGRQGGSRYRDQKTGQFAPKPRCPPHYWHLSTPNGPVCHGVCKKCGSKKDFDDGFRGTKQLVLSDMKGE